LSKVTEKSTSKETGDSIKDVNRAFHDARDSAAQEGGWRVPADRHGEGGSVVGGILSGIGNILKGGKKED
jgi:hypothetical protein